MSSAWEYCAEVPQDVFPGMDEVICSVCGEPSESGYLDRARRVWVCDEVDCVDEVTEQEAAAE